MKERSVIGIDVAKNTFSVCWMSKGGSVKRRLRMVARTKLMSKVTQLASPGGAVVAMEACSGSQHWARRFASLGYRVKLIAGQHVKPFVKSQKNDDIDAEAICEACLRPQMRFVSMRFEEQQEVQDIHRERSRLIKNRTALANGIRGALHEYGITIPRGITHVRSSLPRIIEEEGITRSSRWKAMFTRLYEQLSQYDSWISDCDKEIGAIAKENEVCQRLATVPGIGPVVATAIYGAVGSAKDFKNGRQFAAWLGLVPQQHTTGGRIKLGSISKRGDSFLRSLLIQGAQSVVNGARRREVCDGKSNWKKSDDTSKWLRELYDRAGRNRTVVAMANKTARRVHAVMSKRQDFMSPEQLLLAA